MSTSPEILDAVAALRAAGVLNDAEAVRPARAAGGDLVSVRGELRATLYLGVLLLVSGVGILMKENVERIGPSAIAGAVGLAAGICLAWAWRRSAPPTWGEAASTHPAFDYVLLLGALLAAADLAWVEAQTKLLGPAWPLHLLVVALFYGALAYRFDSRMLLSLALASFAAWRGVSLSLAHASLGAGDDARLRAEALATGALFVAVGIAAARAAKKAHFEDVWVNAGVLLVLGGLLSGVFGSELDWGVWLVALLGVSAAVAAAAYRWKRTLPFAQAVFAAYLGLMRAVLSGGGGNFEARLLLAALLGAAALALVAGGHRRMKIP
jgi:hypothetical protein